MDEMYATFNMGIGMCVVVAPDAVKEAIKTLTEAGEDPLIIGFVKSSPGKSAVEIPSRGLIGSGEDFRER